MPQASAYAAALVNHLQWPKLPLLLPSWKPQSPAATLPRHNPCSPMMGHGVLDSDVGRGWGTRRQYAGLAAPMLHRGNTSCTPNPCMTPSPSPPSHIPDTALAPAFVPHANVPRPCIAPAAPSLPCLHHCPYPHLNPFPTALHSTTNRSTGPPIGPKR